MRKFILTVVLGVMASSALAGRVQLTNADGSPTTAQIPFLIGAAAGQIEGYSTLNKFGHNPAASADSSHMTDIRIEMSSASASVDVVGGFDLLLVDD